MIKKLRKIQQADKIDLLAKVVNKMLLPFLSSYEENLQQAHTISLPQQPVIILIGAPRSGTTLLYQMITNWFLSTYFDNISQLLYEFPLIASKISHYLYKDKPHNTFQSYFGRTYMYGLYAPSEAGIFWQKFFPKEVIIDKQHSDNYQNAIDSVRKIFTALVNYHHQPFIHKNTYLSVRPKVVYSLPNVKVIHVLRNEVENAKALLAARKKFFRHTEVWFSVKPPEYNKLKQLPPEAQVAGQVFFINRYIKEHFSKDVFTVRYEELCENPEKILNDIASFAGNTLSVRKNAQLPRLKTHTRKVDTRIEKQIIQAFQQFKNGEI